MSGWLAKMREGWDYDRSPSICLPQSTAQLVVLAWMGLGYQQRLLTGWLAEKART